jgi:hypothetical protein
LDIFFFIPFLTWKKKNKNEGGRVKKKELPPISISMQMEEPIQILLPEDASPALRDERISFFDAPILQKSRDR